MAQSIERLMEERYGKGSRDIRTRVRGDANLYREVVVDLLIILIDRLTPAEPEPVEDTPVKRGRPAKVKDVLEEAADDADDGTATSGTA